jgi:NAD(P)-dependent dehydrogenase (short-subunit alcohol dehydrogenase family)
MVSGLRIGGLLLACLLVGCAHQQTRQLSPDNPTVLITGANRGLGLEFSRQYAELNWNVIANVRIEKMDVTSDKQTSALQSRYKNQPIDVLLNNAGIYGTLEKQTLGGFDYDELEEVFRVNTIGSLRVSSTFLDNVKLSQQKKIISLGGGMGTQTIGSLFGGHYFIKMSKAAHLMAMGVLQKETKNDGLIIVMISPGRVDTQLMRDSGWTGPSISAKDSAAAVIKQIAALNKSLRGKLITYDGKVIPW